MTIDEIKKDDNLLSSLELPDYKLNLYLIYTGGRFVKYVAFLNGKELFSGSDFRSSPMHDQDSIEAALSLLGFLTTQPGDTDDEYFLKYTKEQRQWAESFECEQLKGLVGDFEDSEKEYKQKARAYFKKHFTSY